MPTNKDFMEWEIKPIFRVYYPSDMTAVVEDDQTNFYVYGLNRGSGEIVRNWEKIHSVEQHNQGYKKMPSDLTITLIVKEQGDAYEQLRRLGKSGILFDVHTDIVRDDTDSSKLQGSDHEFAGVEWMQGFEKWKGCIVNRESQTIEIGDVPIREFECLALRHKVKKANDSNSSYSGKGADEGDGVQPTLTELGL